MIAQPMSLDLISNLPSYIIETILCLVPIHDAARTSILSREWRYKWTKITKLKLYSWNFDKLTENELSGLDQTVASEMKKMDKRCKFLFTIYQILLMRRGPIHEFTLKMEVDETCVEFDHIISHLSRNNAVKKLELNLSDNTSGSYYRIPLSIFLLQHLTDLHLSGCDLNLKSTFNGFRNLTSLYLEDVYIPRKKLLHLLSNCPLKTFTIRLNSDTITCDEKYTVIELLDCLPAIEHLTTWSWITEYFVLHPVPQDLPTVSLLHLKHVSYECMSNGGLDFLAFLMSCSPHVEKIEIEIAGDHFRDEMVSFMSKAYSDICLEHLNELEIMGFSDVKPNLEFVKIFLAKSPRLKKVCLLMDDIFSKNKKSKMLRFLLRSPPASPVVVVKIMVG